MDGGILILMMVAMVAIFYFVGIRPQNKRRKEQQSLVQALGKGDEVVTIGGIVGKVTNVSDQYIQIETGGKTTMIFMKTAVQSQLPKGTIKDLVDG
ncbi:MAG: preprotein translocase subunit YajC [Gammaproteobacteria bacterium]|nr:preprotein translocase subunit YajC [Gammaproteobacteria bacterium]